RHRGDLAADLRTQPRTVRQLRLEDPVPVLRRPRPRRLHIRRQVEESPVFAELAERRAESSAPLGTLFRKNTKEVVLSALIFIGNNAVGYMIIAFFAAYASRPIEDGGSVGLDRAPVLLATTLASFGWLVFTMWGGALSDR